METLRATGPLTVGDVALVPIERTGIRSHTGEAGFLINAFKDIFAVVVCDASGFRALDAESSEIALEELITRTPNLEAILSGLSVP